MRAATMRRPAQTPLPPSIGPHLLPSDPSDAFMAIFPIGMGRPCKANRSEEHAPAEQNCHGRSYNERGRDAKAAGRAISAELRSAFIVMGNRGSYSLPPPRLPIPLMMIGSQYVPLLKFSL